VRERVAFTIMVAILIFLFALTFAVLGKGQYEANPSGSEKRQGYVPSQPYEVGGRDSSSSILG
jgi:hypothetical protein